ncbi:MAG: hypothetical protein ACO1QS_06815 [Verrucomicrobiota bacterium]
MKKRSDYQGLEFDWFAVDSDGFIALMSSAGFGPIPDGVFERFDGQQNIEDFLSRHIGSRTSDDLLRIQRSLALAGVFTYDWKHWDGPYLRFAVPPQPKRFDELGITADLKDAFVSVPERFCASAELRPETYLPCTS